MQEIIVVTKNKLVVCIPVSELITLKDGDTVAAVALIEAAVPQPEEV